MRSSVMVAVVVAVAGCGPVTPQATPMGAASSTASPSALTLQTATCFETTDAELPDAEAVRADRETDPDADAPTELSDLLEAQAASAEAAAATSSDELLTLKAQQWRGLVDAFNAQPASQHPEADGSDGFHLVAGGMEVHAERIAGVWFIASQTHAMPASFCDGGGEPEDVVEEPVALECDGELTEAGQLDYEAGAAGASDDPFEVVRNWVDGRLVRPAEVTLAHIAAEGGPVGEDVAVMRGGRIIAVIDLIQADGGDLLVGSFVACPTELANHPEP